MKRFAKFAPLGAIAAAAVISVAPETASAAPYSISTGGGYNVDVVRNGATETGVRAGPFTVDKTDDIDPSFIAWCFDLDGGVSDGNTYQYQATSFLSTDQQARVQSLFDANYDSDIETVLPDTAAFQIALWDVIYDSDFDINAEGTVNAGFKVTATTPGDTNPTILAQAQTFLDAAKANFEDTASTNKWIITELKADDDNVQNLGFATIPLPAAAWLLLGVSGALVGAKRRAARKAA